MTENEIGRIVVDSAVRLHRDLGPGLFETVYEVLLAHRLGRAGLEVQRQVPIGIQLEGFSVDEAFRADLLVDGKVLIEIECVEKSSNAHRQQLLTYLRLSGRKLGFLLNFGEALMKDGITRIVYPLEGGPRPARRVFVKPD